MEILTTAPPSDRHEVGTYLAVVTRLAAWNERAGIAGMLIYTDNSLIDPWTVAQAVLEHTERFVPLVATQPVYMHPLAAARKVSSLGFLYGRRLALNMVAGGFVRDFAQLGDATEHDARYDRLVEYTLIMQALLRGETVTFSGTYYTVEGLRLAPRPDPSLQPSLYLSGASPACAIAARRLGAVRLNYTKPPGEIAPAAPDAALGLRVGIIARANSAEAWEVAHARFPSDRRGQLAHQLARGTTDAAWHKQISATADALPDARAGVYWLHPLKNYQTFCPYLVGSHGEVADYIAGYRALGYGTLILDVPSSEADLAHALQAIAISGPAAAAA